MKSIKKHSFEAVSLLTVESGVLEVAIIPAYDQPNWLVPKSLVMSVDEYHERIWTYLWRGQEVAVYHLTKKGEQLNKLVVLEGNSDVHRLALQTFGEVSYHQVRISDVKDVELSEQEQMDLTQSLVGSDEKHHLDFVFQTVKMGDEIYIVPDLDLVAHRLVDLDS